MSKPKTVAAMAKAMNSPDLREAIRFSPDAGTVAWLDSRSSKSSKFEPGHVALVAEESHRGVGVVMQMCKELKIGAHCRIKVGQAAPLPAEVRWRVELDSQFVRLGLMYLE